MLIWLDLFIGSFTRSIRANNGLRCARIHFKISIST